MIYLSEQLTDKDLADYVDILNSRRYIFMDKEMLRVSLLEAENLLYSMRVYGGMLIDIASGGRYTNLEPNELLSFLLHYLKLSESNFVIYGRENLSLDIKKVIQPLIDKGIEVDLLTLYKKIRSMKASIATMRQVYSRNLGNVENGLMKLNFTVTEQANQRFYYENENIIGIPLIFSHSIVAPPGYFLISGDIGQADWRVVYSILVRDEKNWEIVKKHEDAYEGIMHCVAEYNGEEFDVEAFKQDRKAAKVDVLRVSYGTRNDKGIRGPFVKKFSEFLRSCARYREYEQQIVAHVEIGQPFVISAYFGNTQILSFGPKDKVKARDTALNWPAQNTTSQIVIFSVLKTLKFFRDMGFGKEDIDVYYVRHDEPIYVCNNRMKDYLYLFQQVRDIVIDDWIPLSFEYTFGKSYKKNEDVLSDVFNSFEKYRDVPANMDIRDPNKHCADFFPLEKCAIMYVGTFRAEDIIHYVIYDVVRNRHLFVVTKAEADTEEVVTNMVLALTPYWTEGNLHNACIYWSFRTVHTYIKNGDIVETIVFKSTNLLDHDTVMLLLDWNMHKYSEKTGLPCGRQRTFKPEERVLIDSVSEWKVSLE
jgi:hypothetical protein